MRYEDEIFIMVISMPDPENEEEALCLTNDTTADMPPASCMEDIHLLSDCRLHPFSFVYYFAFTLTNQPIIMIGRFARDAKIKHIYKYSSFEHQIAT